MKKAFYSFVLILSTTLLQAQITSFPYFENFENTDNNGSGWTTNSPNSDWQLGEPRGGLIRSAFSGSKSWVTNLFGSYSSNSNSALNSPIFDLSALERPYLSFYIQYRTELCCDEVELQYTNDGINWNPLIPGTLSFNYSTRFAGNGPFGYTKVVTSLDSIFANSTTQFRFLFTSNSSLSNEGVSIDDFLISDLGTSPRNDLEVLFVGYDNDTTDQCDSPNLGMIFQNNSTSSILGNDVSINYQVNNGAVVTKVLGTTFPTLTPQSSFYYQFDPQPSPSNGTTKAWIDYSGDVDNSNDTVTIESLKSLNNGPDALVAAFFNPGLTLECTDSIVNISVRVSNLSIAPIIGLPIKYQVNNGPIISEIANNQVPGSCSGGNLTYNFAASYTFQQKGIYSIKAWTDLATDTDRSNDTSTIQVDYLGVSGLPYLENFESGTPPLNGSGSIFPKGWSGSGSIQIDNRTRPRTSDYFYGGDEKFLTLSSGGFSPVPASSPCIAIPNTNNEVYVDFFYFVDQSNNSGSIEVEIVNLKDFNDRQVYLVGSFSGQQQGSPFERAILSLNRFKGKTVGLSFRGLSSSPVGNPAAIDNVRVYESSSSEDLTILRVNSLNRFDCGSLGDSTLSVSILNFGTDTISSFEMCYQVNSETPVCRTVSGGEIFPGQEITSYSFDVPIDLSTPGSYSIKAYINYANDLNKANDTAFARFDNLTQPLPYRENFDSLLALGVNYDLNWQGSNSFQNYFWEATQGNTPSFSTGPSTDGSGSIEGVYLYTESNQNAFNGSSTFIENINCFNLEGTSNLVFEYDYHMYGSSIGSLFLLAYTATDTIVLDSIKGQQQSSNTDSWKRRQVSLDTISSSTDARFAFMAIRGNGDQSDIAIDNITIRDSLTSVRNYKRVLNDIQLYPNPANEYITLKVSNVSLSNQSVQVRVLSIRGQLMERFNLSNRNTFQLNNYSNGVYLLEIISQGERVRKKFIVNR